MDEEFIFVGQDPPGPLPLTKTSWWKRWWSSLIIKILAGIAVLILGGIFLDRQGENLATALNLRLDKLNTELVGMNSSLGRVEGRLKTVEGRLEKVNEHLSKLDERVRKVEIGMGELRGRHLRFGLQSQNTTNTDTPASP